MNQKRVTEFLGDMLLANDDIKAMMSDEENWLHLNMQPVETPFPCLVHKLRFNNYNDESAIIQIDYAISVYVVERIPDDVLTLADLVMKHYVGTAEVPRFYFRGSEFGYDDIISLGVWPSDGAESVRTNNENLQRYDMAFNMRVTR